MCADSTRKIVLMPEKMHTASALNLHTAHYTDATAMPTDDVAGNGTAAHAPRHSAAAQDWMG